MKTPREKALELLEKYQALDVFQYWEKKHEATVIECAKIAVDEITEMLCNLEITDELKFWQEVKQELEIL